MSRRGAFFKNVPGYMVSEASNEPFLNCITDVLLIQVPSGKIKQG